MTRSQDSMTSSGERFAEVAPNLRICYELFGHSKSTIVLVAGLGLQLTSWPQSLVQGLLGRGHQVLVFDNRDVGRSSRMQTSGLSLLNFLLRRAPAHAYAIEDMARDASSLIRHLELGPVHLVGMSMGGMIAQAMAYLKPSATLSLTSIFSTTGAANVGQPTLGTRMRLLKKPAATKQVAVDRFIDFMAHVGPTRFQLDVEVLRSQAELAWDRGEGASAAQGVARQMAAIMKAGDRTAEVSTITAPTLVIHGDDDVLVQPSGGHATANAIAGAVMVLVPGMGHSFPEEVVPLLVDLIGGHLDRNCASKPLKVETAARSQLTKNTANEAVRQ